MGSIGCYEDDPVPSLGLPGDWRSGEAEYGWTLTAGSSALGGRLVMSGKPPQEWHPGSHGENRLLYPGFRSDRVHPEYQWAFGTKSRFL